MAEKSFFFTAVSGSPAYSADDFTTWMYDRLFRKDGVLNGLDNSLAVSFDGNGNALVATGCATKTGHGYKNDAVLTKALTLPTAGYTNINSLVVRVDSSTSPNTMHVVVLVGSNVTIGNTPAAPSITSGTDIYLADIQCTNTAGVYSYSLTDKRVYSPVFIFDTTLGVGWLTQLAASFSSFNAPTATNATNATNALYSMNFDLVIDSDAKLSTWASSGTYEKVLIKSGTWALASGGVNLTARGTKLIVGEPGSKLVFSSTDKGLYYTSTPTTSDYSMDGVSVQSTSPSSSTYAFSNCSNLINCTGNGISSSAGNGSGFYSCVGLVSCVGNGSGVNYGGRAFSNCSNLINCTGNGISSSISSGIGFYSCIGLVSCVGNGLGSLGIGFGDCTKCQQNMASGSSAKYASSYADSGTSYPCADTPNGGFNS